MTEYLELTVTDCKHCYKCIRNCPVKAISFSQNQATILQEECVLCGRCFVICPQNAKHVRNDLPAAKALVDGDAPVVASLAPSFVANWPGATIQSMRKALLQLGFDEADETALGATLVKQQYEAMVDNSVQKVIISTCCHTVNTLVQKHFPGALPYMASILSPMQAHCASIKQHRPGAKTVFIGPCVSKKAEAEQYSGIVDCVLTYEELEAWLAEAGVKLECPNTYSQDDEGRARLFPIPGGILRTMNRSNPNYSYIAVDGMENCIAALEDITTGKLDNCFVEMSACSGSCVGGPAVSRERGLIQKYSQVNTYSVPADFEVPPLAEDSFAKVMQPTAPVRQRFSDEAILEVLHKIGKTKPEDELNCGCCGYDTCRDKARAVLAGKANLEMCLPYLMSKAQSFSDNIIRNTPNGILVLNEALEIQQINGAACKMLNVARPDDVLGQRVVCVMAAMPFIEVLDGGRPIYDRHQYLAEYDRYITLTVTRDREYGLIIAMMRDITETETTKAARKTLAEKTVQVTDEVIDKQMRTVQEIAYLLGETAAETKIALTKLKETLKDN